MDQRAAFDQVVKPEILNRIALRHRLLSRMTLGFAAGAMTVLTFPPLSILLLVPVAYSALFVGLRDLSFGRAFLVGWAFGLGQFGFGIWWIAESFYVEAERFGTMAIPAVAGLSAGLAIFPLPLRFLPKSRGAEPWAVSWPASCSRPPGPWPSGCVVTF
jgi:apolipoprotein N-acyltransferase